MVRNETANSRNRSKLHPSSASWTPRSSPVHNQTLPSPLMTRSETHIPQETRNCPGTSVSAIWLQVVLERGSRNMPNRGSRRVNPGQCLGWHCHWTTSKWSNEPLTNLYRTSTEPLRTPSVSAVRYGMNGDGSMTMRVLYAEQSEINSKRDIDNPLPCPTLIWPSQGHLFSPPWWTSVSF